MPEHDRMDFQKIEKKWRAAWKKARTYEPSFQKARRPFYNLMMFPYPSAEGLHVGKIKKENKQLRANAVRCASHIFFVMLFL